MMTAMGSTLFYLQAGQEAQETDALQIKAGIKEINHPFWLSMSSPTEEDLQWLEDTWGFHPLTLEDCRMPNPRPKLEEYAGYLFLVVHAVFFTREGIDAQDIQAYFSRDYLITVQKDGLPIIDQYTKGPLALDKGTDFLLYRLLNHLSEGYLELLEGIDERIDRVEEQVVARTSPQTVQDIFRLRHDLVSFLKLAAPFREVLNHLSSHEYPYVRPDHQLYFRDVYNTLVSVHEMIETQRDLASGALEVYMSAISNNLNEVMKRLTLIATVFMPISFIAALWGMNFELMPFRSPLVMWSTLALIFLLPLSMLVWFRTRGWV